MCQVNHLKNNLDFGTNIWLWKAWLGLKKANQRSDNFFCKNSSLVLPERPPMGCLMLAPGEIGEILNWDWPDLKSIWIQAQCKNGWLLPKRPFMGCLTLAPGLTWRRVVAVIFPLSSWEAETSVERWPTLGLARPPGLEPELPEDGNFPTTTTEPPLPPPTRPQTEKTYSRAFGQGHFRSRNDNLPRFEEESKS